MKNILIAISLLFTATAAHAANDPCVEFMPCGNYEGQGSWYDSSGTAMEGGSYLEKILIAPVNGTTVNVKVYIYRGEIGAPWADANIVFQTDGSFAMKSADDQHFFGTGFCKNSVCTIAFKPVPVTDEEMPFVNSFVNILRFENGMLKRYNMVSNSTVDGELKSQRSELKKQ